MPFIAEHRRSIFVDRTLPLGLHPRRGCLPLVALLTTLGSALAFGADSGLLSVKSVSASADDGNVPVNVLDGSFATRWSALGDGQWLRCDLGSVQTIGAVSIAWYQGDQRRSSYDI